MKAVWVALVGMGLASQIACATVNGSKASLKELQDSVEAYNDAYRWKNFERAAIYLPTDQRAAFLATYEEDDKALHVEGYRILKADIETDTAAKMTIRVRYMLLPSVTLQKRNVIQHWHKVAGRWILETEQNSIREIDPSKLDVDPNAFGGGGPEPAADLEVEVTNPEGTVIRKDGTSTPSPER